MARDYTIVGPGGRELVVSGPDNASKEQLLAVAKRAFAAQPAAAPEAVDPEMEEADAARQAAARQNRIKAQMDADRKLYSPTKGMSFTDKFLSGMGKAFSDTGSGVAQLFGAGPSHEEVAEQRRLDEALMDTGAGIAGNIGGHVVMAAAPGGAIKGGATGLAALRAAGAGAGARQVLTAAPRAGSLLERAGQAALAPTTLPGAATMGAVSGLAQPVAAEGERFKNAVFGGVAGAGGQALLRGAARVVRPNTSEATQKLLDAGIDLTPGQVLGGAAKRIEDGLTSLPLVGDAIKAGQRRSIEQFNSAAINRALAPIGVKLPKGSAGYEAIEAAEKAISDKYNALMPRLTTSADGQFINEINQLRTSMSRGAIDPKIPEAFERLLNDQVLVKFQGPNATMLGKTFKEVESDLGQLWRKYSRSEDPDIAHLGAAVRQTQDILRRTVERSNPAAAKELKNINRAFAAMERPATAAGYRGSKEGVFSPAALGSAVKAGDKSARKKDNRTGRALLQDVSRAGEEVLGGKVPDSGTPFRLMTAGGFGGLLAMLEPTLLTGALTSAAAYSRPAQALLASALGRRPDAAVPAANALRQLAPYAAAPAIGIQQQ